MMLNLPSRSRKKRKRQASKARRQFLDVIDTSE